MQYLTIKQMKAGRAVSGLSIKVLAEMSNTTKDVISRYETGSTKMHASIMERIIEIFTSKGITFTPDGCGVIWVDDKKKILN